MLHQEVSKYLSHKLVLANCSFYYKQASMKQSLDWAYGIKQLLKYQAKRITEKELAVMINREKTHLQNLLPSPNNKSYQSSLSNFEKIINHCKQLLQPKTSC